MAVVYILVLLFSHALGLVHSMPLSRDLEVADRYIVSLKRYVQPEDHSNFLQSQLSTLDQDLGESAPKWQGVTKRYHFDDFDCYAIHVPKSIVETLKSRDDVDTIEPDEVWNLSDPPTGQSRPASRLVAGSWPGPLKPRPSLPMPNPTVQQKSSWPLGLISHLQVSARTRSEYLYDASAGEGTYGYVIGTGIDITNNDFEGRAKLGYSVVDKKHEDFGDEHGHGTAVAGVVGSKTFGVAKKSTLIAVKVADKHRTTVSAVLDGFQWATRDIRKRDRMSKAVVVFTMSGPVSNAITKAINIATAKGITTITCAGDNGKQVPTSPGVADTAITVSATDDMREKTSWADWGEGYVALFAPGDDIKSTWIGKKDATAVKSGSSLAAGYVAGVALYFKGLPGSTMDGGFQDRKFILKHALDNAAVIPGGTAKFAYNASGK